MSNIKDLFEKIYVNNVELTEEQYSRLDIDGKYHLGTPNIPASVKFVLKKTTTNIPNNLFANTNIISIDIPDYINEIGDNAFNNSDLQEINLPHKSITIGESAFAYSNLKEINLLDAYSYIVSIGDSAFNGLNLPSYIIDKILDINPNSINDVIHEEPVKVTITWNDGTNNNTEQVDKDSALLLPQEPIKEGFTFDGWYTASNGGERITEGITVSSDITFYAHWTEIIPEIIKVTITWNDGTNTNTEQVDKDSALVLPQEPTKEGFTFDGWYTASNGGERITEGITVSSDITFYAHWTEIIPEPEEPKYYLYIGTTKPTELSEASIVESYSAEQTYINNSGEKSHIFVLTNNDKNVTFINIATNYPITQEEVDTTTITGYNIFETSVGTADTGSIIIRIS